MRWLGWLLLLSWQIGAAQAAEWPTLQAGDERRSLVGNVAVLEDVTGKETIESISATDPSRFRTLTRTFSVGYTRSAHWFRFTLQRQADVPPPPPRWLLEIHPPFLDDLRLYEPIASGGFRERRTGDRLAFDAREVPYRGFALSLDLPDDKPRTFFLRLETTSTSAMQLALWKPDAFERATRGEYLLLGGFYGALVIMLGYALMYWRQYRERFYLYFLGQVIATLLFALASNGLAAQYLLPNVPALTDALTSAGTALTHAFTLLFFAAFLEIRRYSRFLFWLYAVAISTALTAFAAVFAGHYTEVAPWMQMASISTIPFSIPYAYRSIGRGMLGSRAVFFGYAWYCGIVLANLLAVLGLLPGDNLLLHGWQYGTLGYIVFLHQGVRARLHYIERQHEEALKRVATAERIAEEEKAQRQAQAQFLSLVSHEIKTPLAMIDSATQALEYQRADRDERIARRYTRIRGAVSQLNELVEKTLSRERRDEVPMIPRLAPVSVRQLMEDSVSAAVDPEHRLVIERAPDGVCTCDKTLLRIALGNLIDNALKYAQPDTPVLFCAEAQTRQNRRVTLFTAENACVDLPPETAERMFEKHWRGANSRSTAGLGLGLYLVRTIAQAHGGGAECKIAPDRVQVSIWIPEPETP